MIYIYKEIRVSFQHSVHFAPEYTSSLENNGLPDTLKKLMI